MQFFKATVFVFLISSLIWSQTDSTSHKNDYENYSTFLGAGAGFTSGNGLSFMKWVGNKWAYQINIFPLYFQEKYGADDEMYEYDEYGNSKDSGYSDFGYLSLGFTYLKPLTTINHLRILTYAGSNLNVNYEKSDYYTRNFNSYYDSYTYVSDTTFKRTVVDENEIKVTLGGGFGGQYYYWRFAFHALIGICGMVNVTDESYRLSPSIEGGVYFML